MSNKRKVQLGPSEEKLREVLRKKQERADRMRKRMTLSGRLKLTPKRVAAIKTDRAEGMTLAQIAEKHSVCVASVRSALRTP